MRMEIEPEFLKFWEYFPKKKSKGDAYKAWIQTKRPPLAKILKAIVILRESSDWKRDGGQWIPYPASWIRAWGWDDVEGQEPKDMHAGVMWWKTSTGIEAKAKELGLEWDAVNGENFQQFTARVKEAANRQKVVAMVAQS